MLKRIIIISSVYVFLIVILTLSMTGTAGTYIFLTTIISLAFSILLFREIFKKYIAGIKSDNNENTYVDSEKSNVAMLKKISDRPFFFGMEKKFISNEDFYFDDDNFYAVDANGAKAIFPLKDIMELSGTSVIISNRRIWQVKIVSGNEKITFKFAPNYTLWNKNFPVFYNKIKAIKPEAVKSKWSLWRM